MEVNVQYLAGFFDGEGTFYMGMQAKNGKEYPKAQVMLSQSGEDGLALLRAIQEQYGGNIYHHLRIGEHKATKDAYKLYWNRDEAILLIEALIPYLILKKTDAEKVLTYLERNIAKELF